MKRILSAIAIVAVLATVAHAGKIVSYNPSYGKPIRVVQTIFLGWNIVRIVTVEDPVTHCKTTTTTRYAFFVPTGETVEKVCP